MSTRQARRGRRDIIALTLAALTLLAIPSAAQAWANGYSGAVTTITKRCLDRAVNDLADLIASARKAAG